MGRKKKSAPDLEKEFLNSQQPPSYQPPSGSYPTGYPLYQPQQQPLEAAVNPEPAPVRAGRHQSDPAPGDNIEKKYHRQQRGRYFLRAALIFLNFALLLYFVYLAASGIMDLVGERGSDAESYISLCGWSKKKSKSAYDKYLGEESDAVALRDYAVVGDRLYVADSHIAPVDLNGSLQNLFLLNVCADEPAYTQVLRRDLAIDFSLLDDGDYLVFPDRKEGLDSPFGHLDFLNPVDIEIFTLPKADGSRLSVQIKNNWATPGLVLKVRTVSSLPPQRYDLAVVATEEVKLPDFDNLNVKICRPADGYACAYQADPLYAVDLTGSSNKRASFDDDYLSFSSAERLESGFLSGYDGEDFIREQSGYLGSAGLCASDRPASCLVTPFKRSDHRGARAFVFAADGDFNQLFAEIGLL